MIQLAVDPVGFARGVAESTPCDALDGCEQIVCYWCGELLEGGEWHAGRARWTCRHAAHCRWLGLRRHFAMPLPCLLVERNEFHTFAGADDAPPEWSESEEE